MADSFDIKKAQVVGQQQKPKFNLDRAVSVSGQPTIPTSVAREQKIAERFADVSKVIPVPGVSQTAQLLKSPRLRSVAKATAIPTTALVSGGIPALAGLTTAVGTSAILSRLPRVSGVEPVRKGIEQLPEEVKQDFQQVGGQFGAIKPPKEITRKPREEATKILDFTQKAAEIILSIKAGIGVEKFTRERAVPFVASQFKKITDLPRNIKAGREAAREIVTLKTQNENLKFKLSNRKETLNNRANALKTKIDNDRKILEASLKEDITRESANASIKTQKELRRIISENSKIYAQIQDDIANKLTPQQKSLINGNNISDNFDKTLVDSADELITEGKAIDGIKQLSNKYRTLGTKQVDLREVTSDMRKLKKLLRSAVRAGREGFVAEEIPIEIARKNIGVFLADDVGVTELANLNKSFIPARQLTRDASRTFQPFGTEQQTKTGTRFIRKLVERKPGEVLPQEEKLFKQLKEGTKGFAKGAGDVDKIARDIQQAGRRRINELVGRGVKISQAQSNIINRETRNISEAVHNNQISIQELNNVVKTGKISERVATVLGLGALTTVLGVTGAKNFIVNILRSVVGVE